MRAKLTFEHDLNTSLQVGDNIWYASTTQSGGYNITSTDSNNFALLGQVTSISSEYKKAENVAKNCALGLFDQLADYYHLRTLIQ